MGAVSDKLLEKNLMMTPNDNTRQRAVSWPDEFPLDGGRRHYTQPVLIVYGSLRSLTGLAGNQDFDGIVGTGEAS
jgi:hypothetical protein